MKTLVIALMLLWPVAAAAQGAVGSGPLTSSLADTEPTSGAISFGSLKVAPGISIREIGIDDNVFDEATNPKSDWVAAGTPDLSAFMRTRFFQLSAYGGADLQYYKKFVSEQSVGYQARARADLLLSRIFPFVGGGRSKTRTRPNGEVDVRADEQVDEFSGGIGYELGAHSRMFVSVVTSGYDFKDSLNRGVSLDQTLSRDSTDYSAGVKTDITPLLSMQIRGGYRDDIFRRDRSRNANSRNLSVGFTFAPGAVVSGVADVGFTDFRPDDPKVSKYEGVIGSGAITFSLLETARINLGYNRSIDYSFRADEGYFITNAVNAGFTYRIRGEVDARLTGDFSQFTYGRREGTPERKDQLTSGTASLGYNLRNRTRVALNYELARRRSPALPDRNYDRRRAFLSWSFAY